MAPKDGILSAMPRRWRRNLVRLGVGSAATGFFLWLFLDEVDLGQAWHEILKLPGWTMLGALALAGEPRCAPHPSIFHHGPEGWNT